MHTDEAWKVILQNENYSVSGGTTVICFLFHNIFFKFPPVIKNQQSQRGGPRREPGEGEGAGQRQAGGRLLPRPPQGAELTGCGSGRNL